MDMNLPYLVDAPSLGPAGLSGPITQFNDLPDEIVEQIIDYRQSGFDRRSRALAQEKCREFLTTHEHDSLVTERLMAKLGHLPSPHLKYYTFLKKLGNYL